MASTSTPRTPAPGEVNPAPGLAGTAAPLPGTAGPGTGQATPGPGAGQATPGVDPRRAHVERVRADRARAGRARADRAGADRAGAHQGEDDRSIGQLVSQATEQLSTLVRQEVRLAQAELKQKGKAAGVGAGAFGGAAVLGWFAVGALVTCAIAALALVWPVWLAALVVAVALLIIAGLMALLGKKAIARAAPPVPDKTMDNVRRDVAAIKEGARS